MKFWPGHSSLQPASHLAATHASLGGDLSQATTKPRALLLLAFAGLLVRDDKTLQRSISPAHTSLKALNGFMAKALGFYIVIKGFIGPRLP